MSTNSKIEWTDATPLRIRAVAASRIGIPLEDYETRRAAAEKWCSGCRCWHSTGAFNVDRSRGDGLANWCRAYKATRGRETYVPRGRPERGRRRVNARGGDYRQARRRVNYLVDIGALPRPNTVPCVDCSHIWTEGERRHEYDHHLGYASEHHEHVECVCTTCHHAREEARRVAT